VQPYSFLASLPALLGFCGFIVYQLLGSRAKGEPITQKIVEKLRRDASAVSQRVTTELLHFPSA
jgi:hypothetical protein